MNRTQPHSSRSPEHDLELLSAYLDNQLSLAERVTLERRLEQELSLRDLLAELRATATALRSLEPLRPPRSFTLDPVKVRRPRPLFRLAWVMQLGSGLAGMLLVVLATVQLLAAPSDATMAPMTAMATAPASATAPMPAAAPAAEMRLEPTAESAATGMAPTVSDAAASSMSSANAPDGAESAPTVSEGAAAPLSTADAPDAQESSGGALADGAAATEAPAAPNGAAASGESAPAPTVQPPGGLAPGFTLALGLALLMLGVTWHLVSRRRV
jgi:hypothetical protein